MTKLKEQLKIAKNKAYSLKTKRAQQKAWDYVRELENKILDILYTERDMYSMHSIKGTVVSDNSHCMSDYIIVETAYGALHPCPTSDILSKSWYPHTCCIDYVKGQEVIIEMDIDVNQDSLTLQLIPKRVYGGTLNEEKYTELCKKDNLAFLNTQETMELPAYSNNLN